MARPKKGFEKCNRFPPSLHRRNLHLQKDSKAINAKERVQELVNDEEKFYRSLFLYINRVRIPPIVDFQRASIADLNKALYTLVNLKQSIEERMTICSLHIAFLTNKVGQLKNSTSIDGLTINDLTVLVTRMKDFLILFRQLFSIFKRKLNMVIENIKLTRSMMFKARYYESGN